MNRDQFEAELAASRYSPAVLVEREVGYELGAHLHEFDAFALVLDGDITLTVNGVAQTYRSGDVFQLPAGTVHLEHARENGVRYLSARRALKESA